MTEEIIGLGKYGKTLTVLYDIDLPDIDEEDSDKFVEESWVPRFKK
jgi:hypothetical protein